MLCENALYIKKNYCNFAVARVDIKDNFCNWQMKLKKMFPVPLWLVQQEGRASLQI